jgi:hypothetical protein
MYEAVMYSLYTGAVAAMKVRRNYRAERLKGNLAFVGEIFTPTFHPDDIPMFSNELA